MRINIEIGKYYKLKKEYTDSLFTKPITSIVKIVSMFNGLIVFTDNKRLFSVKYSNFVKNLEKNTLLASHIKDNIDVETPENPTPDSNNPIDPEPTVDDPIEPTPIDDPDPTPDPPVGPPPDPYNSDDLY